MSHYSRDRDHFLVTLTRAGMPEDTVRLVLRHANTLQRLAVAQCNGDWPADHGSAWTTAECSECGSHWAPSVLKGKAKTCPDCRTSTRLRAIVVALGPGWGVSFAGDPRGYTSYVVTPDGQTSYGGAVGIGIPTRYY